MPFQHTVAHQAHAFAISSHFDGGAMASADLRARSDAPPEALRYACLHANADERHIISQQVAWLVHVFARDGQAPARFGGASVRDAHADARRSDLTFDKQAVKRAWRMRFSHLFGNSQAETVVRDLLQWCRAQRADANASLWHWLPAGEGALEELVACSSRPMREWPANWLNVALTLSDLRDALLPDLRLPNADLRGLVAPGAEFCNGHFNGTWWGGASLRRAGFAFTNQLLADFERADLREVRFRAADLSGARLVKADLRCAEFVHTVARGTDFGEARCRGLTFTKTCLDGASFQRAAMRMASFVEGSAHGVGMVGADAKRSRWTSVLMHNARACGADLQGAVFHRCELPGLDARGAKLNDVSFDACDLRGARFAGASLKRVRIGPGCRLDGSQWHDARVRLDDVWLRQLPPPELDQVARSWMTFPSDQPAERADVFVQLLGALARRPVTPALDTPKVPSLHRLSDHVRKSEWLAALMVAPAEEGGVGEQTQFAGLRHQWLTQRLRDLAHVCQSPTQASWGMAALGAALHRQCGSGQPTIAWSVAGAMCQTLYWAGEGAGGVDATYSQALRCAWFDALPPQVHVALSDDGVDAFSADHAVLIREDGELAMRLPTAVLRGVLGALDVPSGNAGDALRGHVALPGWQWRGTRGVARDGRSHDYVPATMAQLHGLLREFGFLSAIWPVQHRLEAFHRLLGRWLGADGASRARATCQMTPVPPGAAGGVGVARASTVPIERIQQIASTAPLASNVSGVTEIARTPLRTVDRHEALVRVGGAPESSRLRRAAHHDIDEIFRDMPLHLPDSDGGVPQARRVRWVSVVAGLTWLATQPEWCRAGRLGRDVPSGMVSAETHESEGRDGRGYLRAYAVAALNETMSGDVTRQPLPEALALRVCLADADCPAPRLAHVLADWLTCHDICDLPGLAQACAQTLPWFWAIRLPLRPDTLSTLSHAVSRSEPSDGAVARFEGN
ncbi:pentapeptide repeat-containing protein [Pandoraea pnomenusa]|uniref:pentapeptide repeat-containing protein n=1 Tax=Pandoraea pnomenusa TaxID=93220 RepID=UPI00333F5ADA